MRRQVSMSSTARTGHSNGHSLLVQGQTNVGRSLSDSSSARVMAWSCRPATRTSGQGARSNSRRARGGQKGPPICTTLIPSAARAPPILSTVRSAANRFPERARPKRRGSTRSWHGQCRPLTGWLWSIDPLDSCVSVPCSKHGARKSRNYSTGTRSCNLLATSGSRSAPNHPQIVSRPPKRRCVAVSFSSALSSKEVRQFVNPTTIRFNCRRINRV